MIFRDSVIADIWAMANEQTRNPMPTIKRALVEPGKAQRVPITKIDADSLINLKPDEDGTQQRSKQSSLSEARPSTAAGAEATANVRESADAIRDFWNASQT
jgi:hypothetical protein